MKRKIGKEPAEYRREQDRKMAQVAQVRGFLFLFEKTCIYQKKAVSLQPETLKIHKK